MTKWYSVVVLIILLSVNLIFADTLFHKVKKSSSEKALAQNIIVWKLNRDDKDVITEVGYYFWNNRKKILESVCCLRPEEGEVLKVEYSDEPKRQKLISDIRSKGIHAQVTDIQGTISDLYCLKVDYSLPGFAIMFGNWPDDDTVVRLHLAKPANEIKLLEFSNLSHLEFKGKQEVIVTLRNGKTLQGEWKGNYISGHELNMTLEGIDDQGEFISKAIYDIEKIDFAANP